MFFSDSAGFTNMGSPIDKNVEPGALALTSFFFHFPLFNDGLLWVHPAKYSGNVGALTVCGRRVRSNSTNTPKSAPGFSLIQRGIERIKTLADISRSALCCYCDADETRAPIANPPNSAQLEGTSYHSQVRAYIRIRAVWSCGVEGQTHRQTDTQTAVTTVHFASSTTRAKCNSKVNCIQTI